MAAFPPYPYDEGYDLWIMSGDGVVTSGTFVKITVSSGDSYTPVLEEAEEDAVSARKALFMAWDKASRETQFKALLAKPPVAEQKLQRLCYSRERLRMPPRRQFKKRVCGGHQRYRVLVH